jgi:hypothetical protein
MYLRELLSMSSDNKLFELWSVPDQEATVLELLHAARCDEGSQSFDILKAW